jgi:hypothetical protein
LHRYKLSKHFYINFVLISDNDECSVNSGGCQFECIQTPRGAECICPKGLQLNGSKECIGI